ncbi:MAG: CBS domain-containing protein [Syntrophobacterales bacterium]|nr:CBS domain-containing protein [Syntrophobacterales bacterium]
MKPTTLVPELTVITTHVNADFDGMASMIAVSKLYPDGILVFSGSQEKLIRDFFVQTTSYLYGFKKLKEVDLSRLKRLVLVDTRQSSRIGKFSELLTREDLEVHIYDHHPDSEDDIVIFNGQGYVPAEGFCFKTGEVLIRSLGSTTAILTGLIRERGIAITPEEATIMALGLYEDTGSFTFSSTRPEDLEAAAYLLRCGADLNMVSDMITKDLSSEQIAILYELIQSARVYTIHGIDICVTSVSLDRYVGDFAVVVHKFRDIENLNVVFALARMEDKVYMVARSRIPEVNVGEIAAYFGGGGHASAASATIRDKTIIEVENRLWEILKSNIKPAPQARDLMTSPPICIDAEATVKEAEELMLHYSINAVPVLKDGEVVGILSRQTAEKAVYHGFGASPVHTYMHRDIATVSPDQSILDIQKPLIEQHQRILPVVEEDRIVGVITRRDLLKYLVEERSTEPTTLNGVPVGEKRKQKNILSMMRERLPEYIIELLGRLGEVGKELNYGIYAVGGFVRDILLKQHNLDIDIVVEGDGIAFAQIFASRYGLRLRSHRKFNTAVLIFPDGLKVDVASARMEYYRYPAALPVVEFSSLKMDLYRRDFTINTLAIDIHPERFGQLIDYFGGQRDIKEKVIRVLHSLSFVEDPTRILRAIRFEQRFGFQINRQTERLMRNAVQMGLLERLGGYRLFHEFQHILSEENPVGALRRMAEFRIFSIFSPNMVWNERKERIFKNLKDVISWYELSFFNERLERWWVYFFGLLYGLSREEIEMIGKKLDFNPRRQERLLEAYERINEVLRGVRALKNPPPSIVYKHFQDCETEELLLVMALVEDEQVKRMVNQYMTHYRYEQTKLRGQDLKEMGIPPGPFYRKILTELLYARLDGVVRTREDEISYIFRHYPQSITEERGADES